MEYWPAVQTSCHKMTYYSLGPVLWTFVSIAMWGVVVVGQLPPHLAHLQPQGRAIDTHHYYSYNKISHKECRVNGKDGVCMFVWECIKTDGQSLGMCIDGFMFGSCCQHDEKTNTLKPGGGGGHAGEVAAASTVGEEIVPGIATKNTSFIISGPSGPTSTERPTGAPSLITSRPITMNRPQTSTTSSTATDPEPTTSVPDWVTSTTWSREPPMPITPPQPPTRPTRPPKPTKPDRPTHTPWWIQTTKETKPIVKTTPIPQTTFSSSTLEPTTTATEASTTTTTTTTTEQPTTTSTTMTITPNTTTSATQETPNPDGPVVSSAHTKHQCGTPTMMMQPEGRIVNGTNAKFGEWPWQVSVRRTSFFGFSSTHRCGGALLNQEWIATAGHCVDDLLTTQIRIRVGEYDFNSVLEPLPYEERAVKRKVVHPKYNFFTYEYDLALVQLEKPLNFTSHISPICLPGNNDLLIGETATVTGWGRLSEHGRLPSVLQQGSVPIVSNGKCKDMFLKGGRREFIPDIFLCAGYENGGIDSCQGDSGGPLQVKGADGRYFLAGIISWGIGCAEPNLPGVCTRISKFVPWILENVV